MALYSSINLFFINLFTIMVPRWLTPPFAYLTALIFYCVTGEQRRGIRANLRVVLGRRNVERTVFSSYCHYARNWTDIMRMIRLRGERLQAMIGRRSDPRPMEEALANKTGAILISPHFGNWELGGLGLADLGYRITVLTFREPDDKVTDQRRMVREERGIGVIYVDRDDPSPLAIIEAVNALRRNEILCLIGDRDGSSNSVTVDFFGKPTDLPAGAAYLALATGAPIIPVFVPLEQGRYATLMEEPIYVAARPGDNRAAVRDAVQQMASVFERYIRNYPDQWYTYFDYWQN
ncbi:lysophospholipid acyltransferase family protein [Geobacter pelophilus]|uniref:Lysophospholipid acyltransferase family protein n=1 Tax=Geoanaerobacter pelophilus TaxID=60036 RepID=A0AAW4KX99_9BACT|nr:lysophospholipid acyltransferase family protein [Geoanaerobacter pelophilus]MBT0663349.1 lysophospholipid acyltransferase family protein [Geoanaerobacter pelophilus]